MGFFIKVIKISFQTIKKLDTSTITFKEKTSLFTNLKSFYPSRYSNKKLLYKRRSNYFKSKYLSPLRPRHRLGDNPAR